LEEGKSRGYSPGVFVFPFYFHPLKVTYCSLSRYKRSIVKRWYCLFLEKLSLSLQSLVHARWNLFRSSRKRWLYLHKSTFLSSYSSSYFPLPVKNCVMALILSLVDWLYTSCTVIKWSSLPRCMVFKRQSFKNWLPFSKFSQLL
jgi:hypothetical protein